MPLLITFLLKRNFTMAKKEKQKSILNQNSLNFLQKYINNAAPTGFESAAGAERHPARYRAVQPDPAAGPGRGAVGGGRPVRRPADPGG